VATSLIEAATLFEFSLSLACPDGFEPSREALTWAKDKGGDVLVSNDTALAVKGADAVITDTWVSMGDADAAERMKAFSGFQVTTDLMAKASDDAVFLHCLPAHRGEEVSANVIDGSQSLVWQEAENRLHAQKAILAWCLGKI
jgi:ornithine carbamoyltransferase